MLNTEENEFYVVLPSNSPRKDDKKNLSYNFRIDLPHQIQLKDQWEVALSEIIYPNTFNSIDSSEKVLTLLHRKPENLMKDDASLTQEIVNKWYDEMVNPHVDAVHRLLIISWINNTNYDLDDPSDRDGHPTFSVSDRDAEILQKEHVREQIRIAFPDLYYHLSKVHFDLEHIINPKQIENLFKKIIPPFMKSSITYDEQMRKFEVKIHSNEGILLSKQMSKLLGFEKKRKFCYFQNSNLDMNIISETQYTFLSQFMSQTRSYLADNTPYFENLKSMYIYTDIVKYTFVGDAYAPLLRTIPIEKNETNLIHVTFLRPYFIELNSSNLSFIVIEIRDSEGNFIEFLKGNVVLTLHFKKKEINVY